MCSTQTVSRPRCVTQHREARTAARQNSWTPFCLCHSPGLRALANSLIIPGLHSLICKIKEMNWLIAKKSSGYKIIILSQISLTCNFFHMYFSLKMAPCYTLNYNCNILNCPISLLTSFCHLRSVPWKNSGRY